MALLWDSKMRRLRNQAGFTLLEILVALIILSFGLLGVAGLTTGIIRGNLFSNEVTTATTLAKSQLEDNIRKGFNGTSAVDQTTTEDYGSITSYLNYRRVTVIDVGNPNADFKMVTVTVSWNSGAGSVSLTTYLAQ